MTEKIKKINNPLTIIAIFAALAEINATVSLGLIPENIQSIFIWFILAFPTLLVICFFITLNFNTKALYAPSDYKDENNFINSFGYYKKMQINVTKENVDEIEQKLHYEHVGIINEINPDYFAEKMISYGNNFFQEVISLFKSKLEGNVIESIKFDFQTRDLSLLSIRLIEERFAENISIDHNLIVRFSEKQGKIIGEIPRLEIVSDDYKFLSRRIFEYIDNMFLSQIIN